MVISVENSTSIVIGTSCIVGLIFAFMQFVAVSYTAILARVDVETKEATPLVGKPVRGVRNVFGTTERLREIHAAIATGVRSFHSITYDLLTFMFHFRPTPSFVKSTPFASCTYVSLQS